MIRILVLIFLIVTIANSQITTLNNESSSETPLVDEDQVLNELRQYLETKIRQLKLDFHKQFETNRIRNKRDAGWIMTLQEKNSIHPDDIQVTDTFDKLDQQKVDDLENAQSMGEYPISCWTSIPFGSNHLVFLITSVKEFILLNFDGHSFNVVMKLVVKDNAYKAKAYQQGDEIWFVVTHRSADASSLFKNYVQLYVYNGQGIIKKQSIPMENLSDIDIIYTRGYWYLVLGTTPDYASNKLEGYVMLYQWRRTQFDLVAKHASKGIQSIVTWNFGGVLYIGVARSVPGDVSYGSAIYAYYGNTEKISYVQLISTIYAYRVIHFELDGNSYALFLCLNGVHLYWWAGNEFIFYQILEHTENAIDVDSVLLPNGEVALAVGLEDSVAFFTEDNLSQYVKTYHLQLDRGPDGRIGASLASAKFFSRLGNYYYVFLTYKPSLKTGYKQPTNVYKLNLTSHFHYMEERLDPLTSCIVTLNNSLTEKQRQLDVLAPKIEHVWVTDKEQTVTAPIVVRGNVKVVKELDAGSILLTSPIETLPQLTNSELNLELLEQRSLIEALKADSNNLVYKSKEQTIYGPLRFETPPLIRNGHLGALVSPDFLLNGMPVSRLIEYTLKVTGEPQVFVGDLILNGQLSVQRLSCGGSLNGINPQNFFLMNTTETFVTGDLIFDHVTTDELYFPPDSTINKLKPQHFILSDDQIQSQIIEGEKTFVTLNVIKEVLIRGFANGKKLSEMTERVVSIRGNPSILSDYNYASPLVINGNLIVQNPINGQIDVTKLANEALTLNDLDQQVTGAKIFKGPVFVKQDVTVDGLTNGIDVSHDVFTVDTPQHIAGHFVFNKPVHFLGDLETGLVNEIDLSEECVLMKRGPQSVLGLKRFLGNLFIAGDLTATTGATINGIDLSELARSRVTPENFTLSGRTVFDHLVVKNIDKISMVNGINHYELGASLWMKSLDQDVPAPLSFSQTVTMETDLEVSFFNGLVLEQDLLHTFGDEDITGSVSFTEDSYIESPLFVTERITINGYDISEYNTSLLSTDQPCEVHGSKTFPSLDVLGNVVIRGQLNGLKPSTDFLVKNLRQDVYGQYSFNYPRTKITGNLIVDSMNIEAEINGVDFSKFANQVVLKDDIRQFPIEKKHFVGTVKANNVNSMSLLDGVDIDALLNDAVPLKSRGFVSLAHNFTDLNFVGDVYASRINGFPFEEFINRLVYAGEPIIRGPKIVTGSLYVNGDLAYTGFINGINLPEILSRVAYIHGNNTFVGPIEFQNGLAVDNLVISPDSIVDGIPWSELLYLHRDEVISGNSHFLEDVVAEENVIVDGLINGCDLNLFEVLPVVHPTDSKVVIEMTLFESVVWSNIIPIWGSFKLAQLAIYSNAELQQITGSMTIGHLLVNGNLEINNGIGINGVDIQNLALSLVTKNGNNQIVNGPVRFRNGLKVDSLTINSPINEVDLIFLLNDAVSKSVPQTIDGHKQFLHPEGVIFGNGILIQGDLNPNSLVNGIDVKYVHDSAVYKVTENQKILGVKTFRNVVIRGDLHVLGKINGLTVPDDLVLKSTNEQIAAPTHFMAPTIVQGDFVLHRTVDGVDLDHFVHNRATLEHNEVFSADVNFMNKVNINWLEVMGAINNIPMSSVVLKSRNFKIGGKKIITGDVYVDADFEAETINEINVPELERNVVRHDRHEIITGPTVFVEPIEIRRDIIVESNINGHAAGTIRDRYLDYWHSLSDVAGRLTSMTEAQEYQVRKQFEAQKYGFVTFAHFDLIQTLEYGITRMFVYPTYESLSMNPSIYLYGWSASNCDEDDECCSYTSAVFSLDKNGYPTLVNDYQNGRLIPLTFKIAENVQSHNFHFWTNSTTSSYDCVSQLYNLEQSAVFSSEMNEYRKRFHMIIEPSAYVQDVISFDSAYAQYMVVAYSFDKSDGNLGVILVYKYNPSSDEWSSHQSIPAPGIIDLDLTKVGGDEIIFLATAAVKPGFSAIFKWVNEQFVLLTQLPSTWPRCVLWVHVDSNLFLALGNERNVEDDDIPIYTEPIVIYQYNFQTNTFVWFQHVSVQGAVDITSFKLGGETYLVSASRSDQMVSVIQWKGYSGFKLKDEFPVTLVNDLQLFWSQNSELFLVISTQDCRTLVMKANTIGQGLSPLDGQPYYPDYDLLVKETSGNR